MESSNSETSASDDSESGSNTPTTDCVAVWKPKLKWLRMDHKRAMNAYILGILAIFVLIWCCVTMWLYEFKSGYEMQMFLLIQTILFVYIRPPKSKRRKKKRSHQNSLTSEGSF